MLMNILDIKEEEEIENPEKNFIYKKRRYSITDLKKFYDVNDP